MAYNKARAEIEWLKWKNKEENQLRELGVDEDTIQRLHTYDWDAFKSERNYQRLNAGSEPLEKLSVVDKPKEASNLQGLLDEIENERLYAILKDTDKLTIEILLYKMQGYSIKEISKMYKIPKTTIYSRISVLQKKIKNIFWEVRNFGCSRWLYSEGTNKHPSKEPWKLNIRQTRYVLHIAVNPWEKRCLVKTLRQALTEYAPRLPRLLAENWQNYGTSDWVIW